MPIHKSGRDRLSDRLLIRRSHMSALFVCYPKCSTCQKSRAWLCDHGIEYRERDIKLENPTAEELAQIAVATAGTARAIAKIEPRVAMLSFSTKGSAKNELVDKVVKATELAKQMAPDVMIDGEMQADAALVASVGASKAPGSPVAGKANVLIFPSLEVGNISYKLVQRIAGIEAVGPVLQGMAAPINDLSRGCSVSDIVNLVAITVNQAAAK